MTNASGIRIEGGLLSPDFLETIHDQPGQKPAALGLNELHSYHILVDEIIVAADRISIAMIFTGERHFRHRALASCGPAKFCIDIIWISDRIIALFDRCLSSEPYRRCAHGQ